MRLRTTFILLLFVVCAQVASAQTVADFKAKYGKRVDVYPVSEHIWMTPQYAANGQVCNMRFYPKRVDSTTNYGSKTLAFDELRDVLNDLVPLETRGMKKPGFGMSDLGGGVGLTHYEYENVLFTFTFYFRIDPKAWEKADHVDLDADFEPTPVKDLSPTKDDFANSESTEIVTVSWPARKCVKQ